VAIDVAELERLFREQLQPMTRLACLITLDRSRAEQIVREAFTKLWRRRDKLPAADKDAVYLRSIVLNQVRMTLRRRGPEPRHTSIISGQGRDGWRPGSAC